MYVRSRSSLLVADSGCNLMSSIVHVCTVADPASPVSGGVFAAKMIQLGSGRQATSRGTLCHIGWVTKFLPQSWLYLIFGSSRFTDFLWRQQFAGTVPPSTSTPFWQSWKPYPLVGSHRREQWRHWWAADGDIGDHHWANRLSDRRDDHSDARNAQITSNHAVTSDHYSEGVFRKQGVFGTFNYI